MNRRLPLFLLLASALAFLVSLFLPWRESTVPNAGNLSIQGFLELASGGGHIDGWLAISGDVAVLLVVAVVLATVTALRRSELAARLPLTGLGVALGYFAVAVAHETHTLASELGAITRQTRTTSWTYGFYLGIASAGVAVLSGLALRRSESRRLQGTADGVAGGLGVALLIAFLLPWANYGGVSNYSAHGIQAPPAAIAALGVILGAGWLYSEAGRRWRLPAAIAAAILTGGAAAALAIAGEYAYGTWIGIGCAISLVVLEAVRAWPERLPVPPHALIVRVGAAALLIVALFLPWEENNPSGVSYDGWVTSTGAAAGGLCLLLLASPALPKAEGFVLDAVVGVAIFVSAAGTSYREELIFFRVGYGAFLGIAAAGILLASVLRPWRPGPLDRRRALARAVPLAASILCVAAAVVPLWFLLPVSETFQSYALYGSMAVPGVLLGLYLVRLWASRVRGPESTGHRLTVVPLVLLTLASLELIRFRDNSDVIWGAIILVGLSLLLIVFGWIEEEGVRVPEEIWRVDRLPPVED
jgi:hypothetical protein